MFTFFPQYLEELKKEISITTGINQVSPSDCKYLSAEIFRLTQKGVSETTLKRVFGFAYSKFKPSLFTLDALAIACGYNGWGHFCEKQENSTKRSQPKNTKWRGVAENAARITRYTLQIIKNRSGIPYELTIPRDFLHEHLNYFITSDYSATVITAPTGYGKTIALCHWLDHLRSTVMKKNEDILLLFNNSTMPGTAESKGLNEWLLGLLGIYNDSELNGLAGFEENFKGKFYLVIDGLDDRHFKNNQFTQLFTQLTDIVSVYHQYKWFKVIVTLRSGTWINNRHFISQHQQEWFTGFMTGVQKATNVAPFDTGEFDRLSANLHLPGANVFSLELLKKLRNPLFFQIYYQIHNNQPHSTPADELFLHELVASYMLHTTFKGTYSSEKILLITGLINEMDITGKVYRVNKIRTFKLLKEHQNAYQDLISNGVLRELNLSTDVKFDYFTEFADSNVFEFCLANVLLENNRNVFNAALLKNITKTFAGNTHKLPVLKWCIYLTVTNMQPCPLDELPKLALKLNERASLFMFLGGLFKRQADMHKNTDIVLTEPNWLEKSFDHFFGIEFVNDTYEETLETILNFRLSVLQKIIVKTTLASIAVIRLDMDKLERHINDLKDFPDHIYHNLPVNPLTCLESIYYYFKHDIIKKEALKNLTAFYFNPPYGSQAQTGSGTNEILYLIALRTLAICKNDKKMLRFINLIDRFYTNQSVSFKFLWKICKTGRHLNLNNKAEAVKLYEELQLEYYLNENDFTPFMKVTFYSIKAMMIVLNDPALATVDDVKYFIQICDDAGLNLLKATTLALLVSHLKSIEKDTDFFNYFYFDYVKTVRSSGCRTETFLVH